jgi:hypothetical protein
MGIKETKELYQFLSNSIDDLVKHKSDDGKISAAEWIQTVAVNAPAAVKAFVGIDKIDDEFKDASEEELKELALLGADLAQKVAALFIS